MITVDSTVAGARISRPVCPRAANVPSTSMLAVCSHMYFDPSFFYICACVGGLSLGGASVAGEVAPFVYWRGEYGSVLVVLVGTSCRGGGVGRCACLLEA